MQKRFLKLQTAPNLYADAITNNLISVFDLFYLINEAFSVIKYEGQIDPAIGGQRAGIDRDAGAPHLDQSQLAHHREALRQQVKTLELDAERRLMLELEGLAGADSNLLSQLDWQADDDEQTDENADIPVLPQVFILSSGEISPFQLLLAENSDLTPLYSSVSTDFAIPLSRTPVSTELP